jgi:hypothetical protein
LQGQKFKCQAKDEYASDRCAVQALISGALSLSSTANNTPRGARLEEIKQFVIPGIVESCLKRRSL